MCDVHLPTPATPQVGFSAMPSAWRKGWEDCQADRRPDRDGCDVYWAGYRAALVAAGAAL